MRSPQSDLTPWILTLGYLPLKLLFVFTYNNDLQIDVDKLELVSKELNHLVAILHVYAGGLIFMK